MSKNTLSLPKPEFIQGDIDYPEMIKQDFRKAMLIIGLAALGSLILTAGIWLLYFFF